MIAVTGAYGFIGSRLLLRLNQSHSSKDLLAVDYPDLAAARECAAGLEGIPFAGHEEFLRELESGNCRPEVILHMGACSDTTESRWDYLASNNLGYSQRLWNWCERGQARLIYASSAATYGDGAEGFDDEVSLARLRPLNLYGKSKHEFDLWVEAERERGVAGPPQCVGLKFFNVFGPGEAHKGRMASMVFHAYNQIRREGRVRLFKSHRPDFRDGEQLRDFIYVKDVVDAMASLLNRPEVSGLFNLGTGAARSFNDLIRATFIAMGLEPRIDYIPMPDDLQGRYQYFTQATMRKLRGRGVAGTFTTLEDAVSDYVKAREQL